MAKKRIVKKRKVKSRKVVVESQGLGLLSQKLAPIDPVGAGGSFVDRLLGRRKR